MKFPPIYAALVFVGFMTMPPHLSAQPVPPTATNTLGPRLTFATNIYHFGKIASGEQVKYTFIASNGGDQTLVISNVAPGCHCTTAGNWSRQIEPGKTGEIPLSFDSGSFRGEVTKNITVTSNDKLAPIQTITLKGTIWKAIEIIPQFAYISVMPDAISNAISVVHITSQADQPIVLSNPTSANGLFKAELKTLKPGKEYEVTITALPPFAPGNNVGSIALKTSLTNMPSINITAIAMLQPEVVVVPPQIVLPPDIGARITNIVTITANVRKPLALSDPEVSDKRIIVELKETSPGHSFQLSVIVPAGFQVVPGRQEHLSVKSNYADRPAIVVPVSQFPRQPAMALPQARPRVMSQIPPPLPMNVHP